MPPQQVLMICTLAAACWLGTTLLGGWLGDRIGRVRTFQLGYLLLALWAIPMWTFIESGDPLQFALALAALSLPLA